MRTQNALPPSPTLSRPGLTRATPSVNSSLTSLVSHHRRRRRHHHHRRRRHHHLHHLRDLNSI